MNYKILFLGHSNSPIIKWLIDNNEIVKSTEEKINKDFIIINQFDFLISYGYKFIIKKEILDMFPFKAINLHISFLPFNRGADPNFWSFIDETPKGVSIHYIDDGIDTGDIIVQKKVSFPNLDHQTLATTYKLLHNEIQTLFFKNWDYIKKQKIKRIPQKGKFTSHKSKDKIEFIHLIEKDMWNTKVTKLINYSRIIKKQNENR